MNHEASRRKRILVVDDDEHARRSLEYALSEAGYDASGASSGQEALETLHSEAYDLLLIDDSLFDMRIDDVLMTVRSFEIQPLIVVVQAVPRLGAAARFAALGASDAVGKWTSRRDIVAAVRHTLSTCELERIHTYSAA